LCRICGNQQQGRQTTVDLPADVKTISSKTGLSQSAFAGLLGVSVRTLQKWEQGVGTELGLENLEGEKHPCKKTKKD